MEQGVTISAESGVRMTIRTAMEEPTCGDDCSGDNILLCSSLRRGKKSERATVFYHR